MGTRWFDTLAVGSLVDPTPWNESTAPEYALPVPTRVLDFTIQQNCQSGILFVIEDADGRERRLDPAWFLPYEEVTGEDYEVDYDE